MRNKLNYLTKSYSPDDQRMVVTRNDFSGGVNNRQHPSIIKETQVNSLSNADIIVPGEVSKRPGSLLIGNDVGDVTPVVLHNYEIQGATDQLLMYENTSLHKWEGSGNWAALKSDFTASTDVGIVTCKMSGISPDDIVIVQNGTEAFGIESDGTLLDLITAKTNKPTLSTVMCWYGNRVWILKNDILSYSDAYPADYGEAFDSLNSFRIPVGTERKLLSTRDTGIVVMGEQAIWGLAPSATPAATDRPQPIITDHGVVSKKGAVIYGDDIYYFSKDGFRALKRTIQDKLQLGVSYPLSYTLKNEFSLISWGYISKLSMEVFDNKIFIAVPTSSTTYDTWVYYPANGSFMIISGWSPSCWSRYKISGEEQLYYGKEGNGAVYKAWSGYTDEGTTTTGGTAHTLSMEGREEDMGQPLIYKVGGEIELTVESAGSGLSFEVFVALDGRNFQSLGTIDLSSDSAPVLPVNLPFTLADSYVVRQKFHLESLGRWRTLQVKIENTDKNTETIKFYSYSIVTYPEEYENEEL